MAGTQAQARREYAQWIELCQQIQQATPDLYPNETPNEKQARIARLTKPTAEAFQEFCKYYFPHYMQAPFAYFHLQAQQNLIKKVNKIQVAEWPRGHAKSVFFNVFMPLYLLATKQLTGMILVSENEEKAQTLLGDIQAELTANHRIMADFNTQSTIGAWRDGHFVLPNNIGFWAFGIKQNPAGTRKANNRPNYITVDDADSRQTAKNQDLTIQRVEWVKGELLGCVTGNKTWRMVIANNRVASNGLLAHIVGDINPEDKPDPNIIHQKVFATQDPKTRKMLMPETGGQPAWPEFYSLEQLQALMKASGHRAAMRNFYHLDIQDGNVFRAEHIQYIKPSKPHEYTRLISYCDPSFKDAKSNDYKAIVLIGVKQRQIHILECWIRQASITAMVNAHADIHEKWLQQPRHYIEANFLQDIIAKQYQIIYEERGYHLPITPDKRKKPDKYQRIEGISPLFEQGVIFISEGIRNSTDLKTLLHQLFAFPSPQAHDDGPDALEGAISIVQNNLYPSKGTTVRMGKQRPSQRRIF